MAGSLISIFYSDTPEHLRKEALRDMVKLAGVLTELREYFEEPLKVLEILKMLNLIQQEALGLDDPLEDEEALFYRFRNRYGYDPNIPMERLLNILQKYNWIIRGKRRLTMMDVGKRMMDMLIRLVNDSLAYYMQDEVARSLFQARRDADLSEAYDDKGISGGNRLASMIRNVEDAVDKLKERQLEFLADRHALPQIQIIVELMQELNARMDERLAQYATFEEGISFAPLLKKGTEIMFEGTQVSLGTLNKFLKFAHLQQTEVGQEISPIMIRQFIIQSFLKRADSDLPSGHEILSFLEQDRHPGERLDGMWVPVQFASPVSNRQLADTVNYLEHYVPSTEPIEERVEPDYRESEEWTEEELGARLDEIQWHMTKAKIRTDEVERVLEDKVQLGLDELVWEAGSSHWTDAVNALLAVSALAGSGRAVIGQTGKARRGGDSGTEDAIKEWEIVEEGEKRYVVRRSGAHVQPDAARSDGTADGSTESG
ncbi:hypothetical protein N0M98_23845 [Paenibacillus doosanensis]|uniref:Uncharacterized protein n=1 Tax=Paenibacillus konkukensis TaxID=2020716 RepID=A0ABY4RLJ7_9BACL|nr:MULTISPECIES: hypothetical protein [Paenibacillus]MCS7463162.1 hypothetical protein [Paenibacillus doosanensis]UQZ83003.1 hypothetical protein SK3146_02163 [Paenibacillus konkukensis]